MMLRRYGSPVDVVRADGFTVDRIVYATLEGDAPSVMARNVGIGMVELAGAFWELKPDLVLAIADRYETLGVAATAALMNIPIAHIQGGEITGTIDESIRHSVTKLSHLHFACTEASRDRIIQMGEDPARVFHTGCPALDLLSGPLEVDSADLSLAGLAGLSGPYAMAVYHPVTTNYASGEETVRARALIFGLASARNSGLIKDVLWFQPNNDAGSDKLEIPADFRIIRNLPPLLYGKFLAHAAVLVGNSSSFIREGSFLGTPTVLYGSRQEGRETGSNIYQPGDLSEPLEIQIKNAIRQARQPSDLYGDGHSGPRIAALLRDTPIPSPQKRWHFG